MKKNKTKRILKIIFILASAASLYFVPWLLVKAWILPLPNSVQQQLDEAINHGFNGIIVYIDQTGKPKQYYAAGWHNKETKQPAYPNALFKIASISKLYNAVAITKLVNNGILSLDKTLAQYLPELKDRIENADKITLRMLLQHRSGIPNFTNTPNFWEAPTTTYKESLDLILDKPANFKPNKNYEYCNTNYLLLNKIMDNTLGYDNFKYIYQNILKPLNLNHTYSSLSSVNIEKVMSGYHVGYPFDLKESNNSMHATAKDVGTFLRALNNGTIFEPNEAILYKSIYKLEHSGWIPGYQSFAIYNKELDAVIIVFYNTTDSKLYYWNLAEIINSRIIKILKNK